jgi:hypothetical protein
VLLDANHQSVNPWRCFLFGYSKGNTTRHYPRDTLQTDARPSWTLVQIYVRSIVSVVSGQPCEDGCAAWDLNKPKVY